MIPQSPTPEWAVSTVRKYIDDIDEPEALYAALELLAAVAPSKDQDKFKHEAAWAAIEYGYKRTSDVRVAAKRYLEIAV
jgi:hypothetical protein